MGADSADDIQYAEDVLGSLAHKAQEALDVLSQMAHVAKGRRKGIRLLLGSITTAYASYCRPGCQHREFRESDGEAASAELGYVPRRLRG